MDFISISLDFIHVFECEFLCPIVSTIFFVICHFKNIKVFYTSSKYQNSFLKRFQYYFNTKFVYKTVFQSISIYKPLPHSYEKSN